MSFRRTKYNRDRAQKLAGRRAGRNLRFESLEDRRVLSAIPLTANSISLVESSIAQTAPTYGKLGEALWQLTESADGSLYGMSKEDLASIIPYRDDEVAVQNFLADGDPTLLLNDLQERFGIREVSVYGDKLEFWSPRSTIKQLEALEAVKNVGLLSLPVSYVGAATSQGDDAQRTDVVRSFQGLTGTGITVGVISDSYNLNTNAITDANDDISTGDLPGAGNPLGNTQPVTIFRDNRNAPNSRSDEGRAMLQIVHDVSPGARLVFSNDADQFGNPSEAAFAANITSLWQTQNADVIVDDLIYY